MGSGNMGLMGLTDLKSGLSPGQLGALKQLPSALGNLGAAGAATGVGGQPGQVTTQPYPADARHMALVLPPGSTLADGANPYPAQGQPGQSQIQPMPAQGQPVQLYPGQRSHADLQAMSPDLSRAALAGSGMGHPLATQAAWYGGGIGGNYGANQPVGADQPGAGDQQPAVNNEYPAWAQDPKSQASLSRIDKRWWPFMDPAMDFWGSGG